MKGKQTREHTGTSLAPGKASGRLHVVASHAEFSASLVQLGSPVDTDLEQRQFETRVTELLRELNERAATLSQRGLPDEADIVRTHIALLEDDYLRREVLNGILEGGITASAAVEQSLERMARELEAAGDEYFKERAADFRDLTLQLLEHLSGCKLLPGNLTANYRQAIILTEEILPSLVLAAWENGVAGIVVSRGTGLSHAAIIAQSVGIPVVRLDSLVDLHEGHPMDVVVNGDTGTVVLAPTVEACEAVANGTASNAWREAAMAPATISLSVVSPDQVVKQDWRGLQGIGLYRTEMLFLQHPDRFPSEDEQLAVYRRLFNLCGDREAVVRTVDLGADKSVPHMHFGPELNPYLGLRAHRLFHYHPEILITQLRAVLRAAAGRAEVHILFPMLETVDQWEFVHTLLNKALASLLMEKATLPKRIKTGVLVETPAAVWSFPELIKRADFASVGTNDLVQYTFTIERDAPNVARFYQPEHPVMLRVLRQLVQQASAAGKPLSLCGAIASEPRFLPLLLGIGFEHFAVAAAQAVRLGQALAKLDPRRCRKLADACLAMQRVAEVRAACGFEADKQQPRQSGELAVDPVCGMAVRVEPGTYTLDLGPVRHYFCSACCMEQYAENRGVFLRHLGRTVTG